MPAWSREPFRDAEAVTPAGPRGTVMLLVDTFNRYFEPENLRAALRVLRAAGYGVVIPSARGPAVVLRANLAGGGNGGTGPGEAWRTMRRWPGRCRCWGWNRPVC